MSSPLDKRSGDAYFQQNNLHQQFSVNVQVNFNHPTASPQPTRQEEGRLITISQERNGSKIKEYHRVTKDPNRPDFFPQYYLSEWLPSFWINQNGETIVEHKFGGKKYEVISPEKTFGYDLVLFIFHFFYLRINEFMEIWPIFIIGGQLSL